MINHEKQSPRNSRENSRESYKENSRENFRDENFKPNIGGKTFFRAGQIFTIIYHLSLLALIYILVEKGEVEVGLKIFAINAALLVIATLVSTIERIFFNKNRPYKRNFKRNNKPRRN